MEEVADLEGGSGFRHDKASHAHREELANLIKLDASSLVVNVSVVLGLGIEHIREVLHHFEGFLGAAYYRSSMWLFDGFKEHLEL